MKSHHLLINPDKVDIYESPPPFHRFIRLLVDPKVFPETPMTVSIAQYPPGARSPSHLHKKTTEIYFILKGTLTATIQGVQYKVREGHLLYIPPGYKHSAKNRGIKECCFLTINTPITQDIIELKIRKTWKKVSKKR
jgi:mannose-6-phosphate isomerase-like protein (cupin superfamily)